MKWKKFTLKTTTQAVDLVSSMFDEIGIEGIEIEDNIPLTAEETKGMFIDILPELPPDEGVAFVSFYLDDSQDVAGILERVEEGLNDLSMFTDLGERTITESETEDKDWINNWKQYFKPFTVDDILIKPTWEEIPEEHKDKLLIQIDPGTAFGTGQHETTQLCIRQLRKYVTPETVLLDVGTGSGILGITALKLGATPCSVRISTRTPLQRWEKIWRQTGSVERALRFSREISLMIRRYRTRPAMKSTISPWPIFWRMSLSCFRGRFRYT